MPFIKLDGGRSKQFLNNISGTDEPIKKIASDLKKNRVRFKKASTWGNTRAKFDFIRFDDVITRAKKGRCFFVRPSRSF